VQGDFIQTNGRNERCVEANILTEEFAES
jgi:hypothetical protein